MTQWRPPRRQGCQILKVCDDFTLDSSLCWQKNTQCAGGTDIINTHKKFFITMQKKCSLALTSEAFSIPQPPPKDPQSLSEISYQGPAFRNSINSCQNIIRIIYLVIMKWLRYKSILKSTKHLKHNNHPLILWPTSINVCNLKALDFHFFHQQKNTN